MKILFGPPRVHPAAPTVLQVVPRCQNGPTVCSRDAKMVSQCAEMEAPSPLNGNREELKGVGGREHNPNDTYPINKCKGLGS